MPREMYAQDLEAASQIRFICGTLSVLADLAERTHTQDEGSAFFRTVPDIAARNAVLAPQQAPTGKKHLKVV
jgi:hypothetical protein